MLHCKVFSTNCTAVSIKKCSKSTSVINVATIKMWRISCKGSHHMLPPNQCILLPAEMNGTQRRTLVIPWKMYYIYYCMQKGTSWTAATSRSKKTSPQPFQRYHSVSSRRDFWKNSCSNFWKHIRSISRLVLW